MSIHVNAIITLTTVNKDTRVVTVGDIRDFLEILDSYGVPNEAEMLEGYLAFDWITDRVEAIDCAEHAGKLDFVVFNHECEVK